jgi:hypothetical protein
VTGRSGDAVSVWQLTCKADIEVKSPQAELLVLCEGEKSPSSLHGKLTINGQPVEMESVSSTNGWSATILPQHEHWLFLRAPLKAGPNAVVLDECIADSSEISAWVWATRPADTATSNPARYPNSLPQPETVSLDGVSLIPTTATPHETK